MKKISLAYVLHAVIAVVMTLSGVANAGSEDSHSFLTLNADQNDQPVQAALQEALVLIKEQEYLRTHVYRFNFDSAARLNDSIEDLYVAGEKRSVLDGDFTIQMFAHTCTIVRTRSITTDIDGDGYTFVGICGGGIGGFKISYRPYAGRFHVRWKDYFGFLVPETEYLVVFEVPPEEYLSD